MLTDKEIVAYLVERGLIDAKAIEEGVNVLDSSRRNRNVKVLSPTGPSYFVKQGTDGESTSTLAHEALVYGFLERASAGSGLRQYLPTCFGYDPQRRLLVFELVQPSTSLREHHARCGRFSMVIAREIGEAMGAFHDCTRTAVLGDVEAEGFPSRRPWVLSLCRPTLQLYRHLSAGQVALIRILQQFPDISRLLGGLDDGWSTETLIHSDVKGDNYLVVHCSERTKHERRVRMVDWELTGAGDPCWDAGAILADYLGFWVLSIPIARDVPLTALAAQARYPLPRMQPAIKSFWESYTRRMALTATEASARLVKTVRYGAARLLQTAFEQMQASHKPTAHTICLMQLSQNMMQRPDEAAQKLLGF